jgi:hypothetical protein
MKYPNTNHPTNADEPIAEADMREDRKAAARRRMREQYIHVCEPNRYYVRETGELITRRQFNLRNIDVAPFGASGARSAHAIFINDPLTQMVARATYRPFRGEIVDEGKGPAVNAWRPPETALALAPEDIESAFQQVAEPLNLLNNKQRREGNYTHSVFRSHWPYCFTKLQADGRENLWLPLGRGYMPICGDQQGFYGYEQCSHLAWQFTCDPRQLEGGWRVIQGDRIYLYKDGETGRVRDLEVYLGRVGRLIAAGTGENAIIYARHLLSTLPKN